MVILKRKLRIKYLKWLKRNDMFELYEQLKKLPKEILELYILDLMKDGKINFADIAKVHVEYLEALKRGETEKLMNLRSKVIDLWVGTKKELPSKLVALVQEGKDNGWINIDQEKIDNSKWNR